jgi:hypothetical protein
VNFASPSLGDFLHQSAAAAIGKITVLAVGFVIAFAL